MIIILNKASEKQVQAILEKISEKGFKASVSKGASKTIIGVIGKNASQFLEEFQNMPGVEQAISVSSPFKLASSEFHVEKTTVNVGKEIFGNNNAGMIAGPCSAESLEQVLEIAEKLHNLGVKVLRGSLFKPRSSPYEFQGLGLKGLEILEKARSEFGLAVETEVMDVRDVKPVSEVVDCLRVGARNMQNFDLLKEVGRQKKPVILKRGLSASIKEWLLSAEYILNEGNLNVILCERGIRTFETECRNTADISAIPLVHKLSHLPVIFDPSHAAGRKDLITPLSLAAIAAGADGLLVEVHSNPEKALSDAKQQLTPSEFEQLLQSLRPIAKVVGKTII